MKKSFDYLNQKKLKKNAISMITCYDYLMASIIEETSIDTVLVGDSLGTNLLGYSSEKEVTMQDIIHHTKAVCRGIKHALVVVDLPYKSYTTTTLAVNNALLLQKAGADAVKFEGFYPEVVKALKKNNIPCVCHLGLLPQTASTKKLQAADKPAATLLLQQAKDLEAAGADLLILELVPEEVAKQCANQLTIPVIGIAAGRFCDGQVQILYDILGLTKKQFKHVPLFEQFREQYRTIFQNYHNKIEDHTLLDYDHSFHIDNF